MNNQYLLERLAGRDPNLRAADADRERIAERLRNAHTEGRLDIAEFQQRLERCYEAKTFGELGPLVRDLPREEPGRRDSLGWLRASRWLALPLILTVLIVTSAAGGHHASWLWIPFVFLCLKVGWWRRRRSWAAARRGWQDWV
jgi:hypothetical protein